MRSLYVVEEFLAGCRMKDLGLRRSVREARSIWPLSKGSVKGRLLDNL